jgi:hypothetical protein
MGYSKNDEPIQNNLTFYSTESVFLNFTIKKKYTIRQFKNIKNRIVTVDRWSEAVRQKIELSWEQIRVGEAVWDLSFWRNKLVAVQQEGQSALTN